MDQFKGVGKGKGERMNKRFMNRKAGKVLAAAAAVVGFAAVSTPQADAGITIDLRAAAATNGAVISPDGKTVTVDPGSSALVQVNVIARLTGADAVQNVANFDNKDKAGLPPSYPVNDTRNNDLVQFVVGSFNTTGTLKGNYDAAISTPTAGFSGNASHPGAALDFDGDGNLDIGYAPGSSTDATNLWSARANSPLGATRTVNSTAPGGAFALTGMPTSPVDFNGTTGVVDNGGPVDNNGASADKIEDASTSDVVVGQVYWTVTGGSGSSTLNFLARPNGDAQVLWYQDGSSLALNSVTSANQYSMSPLTVQATGNVPEPASLGLLGLLGAGLVSRRRRKA
jgi:hypothetical protein